MLCQLMESQAVWVYELFVEGFIVRCRVSVLVQLSLLV